MKKKCKITFEITVEYPFAKTHVKRLSKDFDKWLKDWALAEDNMLIPVLLQPNKTGAIEQTANAATKITIVRDDEVILNVERFEKADDY